MTFLKLLKSQCQSRINKVGPGVSRERVEWTETHQNVLCELIDVLTCSKVISFPNFEEPFVLQTDAPQDGLRAMLYQAQDDGHLVVIAYGLRTLTPAE